MIVIVNCEYNKINSNNRIYKINSYKNPLTEITTGKPEQKPVCNHFIKKYITGLILTDLKKR